MAPPKKDVKFILAIDHGTSGVKSTIISTYGEILDFEFEKTPIYFLPDGGVEQDPDEWWQAVLMTSKKLVAKNHVPVDEIIAVCCSSTFSSMVAVDRSGNHLMNAITWMDPRGAPHIKRKVKGIINIEGYSIPNILKWVTRTGGGPLLSGKDDISHVLFLKNERPEIYDRTYMFLESKDYLNLKFTGRFAASYDSIMLFWVTDIRDIHNIRYDETLIKTLEIDKNKLPPLKRSTEVLDTISREVAEEIGLNKDVKVITGSPDHQSACVGSGAVKDFEGHIYIGTSSWILCHIPFKKTDIFNKIASIPSAIPGKYFSVNEQDTAGGCLPFLLDNIIYHENELRSSSQPPDAYDLLDKIASRVPAGSNKLIFVPWLNGELTPVDDENLRGGLFNISLTTNLDHIIRAVLEGVAYNNRWALKYVEKFIGRKLDPLNIIGGGAQSNTWCQIFADVLNRTIRQVKDPMLSNARGAAFIASVALGYITFDDIPNLMQYANTFHPNPDNQKCYDELFQSFLQIHKNNKKLFRKLNNP